MILHIHITPNAKKAEVVSKDMNLFGETIWKIKVAAPPVEGKANKELIDFLSKYFKTAKSNIKITHGLKNRNKVVEIIST